MTLNVSPQMEAKLFEAAKQEGIDPSKLIEKLIQEYEPNVKPLNAEPPQQKFTAENDPLMERLEARIAAAPIDPEAIQEAEQDLKEFMRNMNAARKEIGARLPYPETE